MLGCRCLTGAAAAPVSVIVLQTSGLASFILSVSFYLTCFFEGRRLTFELNSLVARQHKYPLGLSVFFCLNACLFVELQVQRGDMREKSDFCSLLFTTLSKNEMEISMLASARAETLSLGLVPQPQPPPRLRPRPSSPADARLTRSSPVSPLTQRLRLTNGDQVRAAEGQSEPRRAP